MFIVLQLVFALAVSVLLVLMVSKSENYKSQVESTNIKNVAMAATNLKSETEKTAAQAKLSDVQAQLNAATNKLNTATADAAAAASKAETANLELQNQIVALRSQITSLNAAISTATSSIAAKDKELEALRPQVADLTTKYNEIYRAKNEADNQLRAAEQAIRKLQEIIAQAPATGGGAGGVTPMGDQVQVLRASSIAAAGKVNGRVSGILPSLGKTLIEMPLGTRDGIQVGTKIFVYRASGYIGDATVTRVTPDQSVATIDSTKQGETVQMGDLVSTTGQ
jgi:uncharacterized protein YlxW (UPF0749 family)